MEITIKEIDPIMCKISHRKLVMDLLSFNKEYWRTGLYKMEQHFHKQFLVDEEGRFYTGFLPKVVSYLEERGHRVVVKKNNYGVLKKPPNLPGVTFRDDQLRQINDALSMQRGVVLAPTGTGKGLLIPGIVSCYPNARVLILVHTLDLLKQAEEIFRRFNMGPLSFVRGGEKDLSGRIVMSTIQSLSKLKISLDDYDIFDIIISDEAHHSAVFDTGGFFKIFSRMLAPIRFGFTATLPEKIETRLVLEGLIGPVISEFTFEEAKEKEILSAPKIQLIKVEPFLDKNVRTYHDIYANGIVYNDDRNRQIIKAIKTCNEQGLSTLTYVQQIEHIKMLMDLAKKKGVNLFSVHGGVYSNVRQDIKKNLDQKKIMNVIATVVWREGLNIPSLDTIIIAGGGKNEKDLIQACGRGARRTDTKTEFLIIDFVDSAKYLSQHFCERLGVYIKFGWIGENK